MMPRPEPGIFCSEASSQCDGMLWPTTCGNSRQMQPETAPDSTVDSLVDCAQGLQKLRADLVRTHEEAGQQRQQENNDMAPFESVSDAYRRQLREKKLGGREIGFEVNEEEMEFEEEEDGWEEDVDKEEEELDPRMAAEARNEEVEFMINKLSMFEFGTLEDAMRRSGGKMPTTTKWVEGWKTNEDGSKFVRSRLVGRDFKPKHGGVREDLFAAMPPLEAKKALFRMTAGVRGQRKRRGEGEVKLMFVDVKKAHLNAKCEEEVWVELPKEMWKWGRFARLKRWLYGMRKAAVGWEEDYAAKLVGAGFRRGIGAPTVFFNPKTKVRVVVHGDDFTFAGERRELEEVRGKMEEWYEVKVRGIMGSGEDEVKELTILGRTVRWTQEGLEYEADGKHRRELMKAEGLTDQSKAAESAIVRERSGEEVEGDRDELWGEGKRRFRGKAARLNYLGQDRSDVQYAAKLVCSGMSKPTVGDERRLKRVVRYLVGMEKVVWNMGEWDDGYAPEVDVFVDSDWAKGEARKSTSGGMIVLGGTGIKHWSRTQKTRSLSVGEAEYYAIVTGCAEGLGIQALLEDMGWVVKVRLWTDSSTAKAVAGRRGLGKLRHVELRYLWVQEMVRSGRVLVSKVQGEENVADHLTKEMSVGQFERHLGRVGCEMVRRNLCGEGEGEDGIGEVESSSSMRNARGRGTQRAHEPRVKNLEATRRGRGVLW